MAMLPMLELIGNLFRSREERAYAGRGYFIFRNVLPLASIEAVHAAVDRDVRTSTAPMRRHPSSRPEANIYHEDNTGRRFLANALLDPQRSGGVDSVGQAIVELVCTDDMADRLKRLDGRGSYTLHQTILFFIPPNTDPHVDGWGLDTFPMGFAHTLWIPLEPVDLRNGPIAIFPWKRGRYLTPQELGIDNSGAEPSEACNDYLTYHHALMSYLPRHHPDCVTPHLWPGDLVVFTSLTPHGTLPFHRFSRIALQVLVRPSAMPWGSWPALLAGHPRNPDEPKDEMVVVSPRWRYLA